MEKKTNGGDWSGYVAIQDVETKQYLSGFVVMTSKGKTQECLSYSDEIGCVYRIDLAIGIGHILEEAGHKIAFVVDEQQ